MRLSSAYQSKKPDGRPSPGVSRQPPGRQVSGERGWQTPDDGNRLTTSGGLGRRRSAVVMAVAWRSPWGAAVKDRRSARQAIRRGRFRDRPSASRPPRPVARPLGSRTAAQRSRAAPTAPGGTPRLSTAARPEGILRPALGVDLCRRAVRGGESLRCQGPACGFRPASGKELRTPGARVWGEIARGARRLPSHPWGGRAA
jgi:hypothetical protein